MKNRLRTSFALMMAFLSVSFCNDNTSFAFKKKFIGLTSENIGVVKGNIMYMYAYTEKHTLEHEAGNTFTIPADAKDIFYCGEKLGVLYNSGKVEIFKNIGRGEWTLMPDNFYAKGTFMMSKDYERVVLLDSYYGYVKGKTIDFFKNTDGKQNIELQFIAPPDALDMVSASGNIIVRTKQGLSLYEFNSETGWNIVYNWRLPLPQDFGSLLMIAYDSHIGIVHGGVIDLYTVDSERVPSVEYRFRIPK